MPCMYCQKLISEITTVSCIFEEIQINGNWHKRRFISFGGESLGKRCRQCGITIEPSHFHHYGCKNEECPACFRRIIACECEKTQLRNEHGEIVQIEK